MKRGFSLTLVALAAVAVFAACSGSPTGSTLPSGTGMTGLFAPDKASTGPRIGHVYTGLDFDGTTFTVNAHRSCGHRGLGGLKPYTATASGALVLTASPSVAPTCAPNPLPSTTELFIFAIPLKKHGVAAGGPHWGGVEVAGPAAVSSTNEWVFPALAPGLTTVSGARYDFVIATAYQHPPHPTPAPSSSPGT